MYVLHVLHVHTKFNKNVKTSCVSFKVCCLFITHIIQWTDKCCLCPNLYDLHVTICMRKTKNIDQKKKRF